MLATDIEEGVEWMKSADCVPYDYFSPADIVTDYLRHGFGALVGIFEELKHIDPDTSIRKLGQRIANALRRLYEVVRGELHGRHNRLFTEAAGVVCDLTTPGLVAARRVPMRFAHVPPVVFRKMVIDRVIDGLRHLFVIMRDTLRFLELRLRRNEPRIVVGSRAAAFVYLVDRADKLLVLVNENGRKEAFNVSSPKVWSYLRLLIETKDPEGLVELPKNFRSAFVSKDADGNQMKDDLWQLSLHIHSARGGKHYLSPTPRTPNTVDL